MLKEQGDDGPQEEDEAGEPVRCLPCPGTPTVAERALHEVTHWPYRPWCEACVRGRAVGPNSKKVDESMKESIVPKAHLDYAFLQDEVITDETEFSESGTAQMSMTILVMLETLCDSIWAYATRGKGVASDPWLPKRIAGDLETVGLANVRVVVKTDAEPAIVDVKHAVAEIRGGTPTGQEESRVGDSNSNGKVERSIREVKGLIRTLRADLQMKTGGEVKLDSPVVPWMVRHAGYVLTRCRILPCGRTAMHKLKGQRTNRPLIPFGETVMFKIPQTKTRIGDFEDRFEKGVWLGMTMRTGENIVATSNAVFKVGGVMRRPPDQRWSSELIAGIKGSPAEPRPGSVSDHIPTYARQAEEKKGEEYKDKPEVHVQRVRPARITRSDLEDHGRTPNCKACNAMHAGRSSHPTGGHAHSHECRLRFEDVFRESGAEKLKRADTRMNEEIYRQERQEVEGEAPRAEEEKT